MPAPPITARDATHLGWLRRRDLDTPNGTGWELPDGSLTLLEWGRLPAAIAPAPPRKRTPADHAYLAWLAKRSS